MFSIQLSTVTAKQNVDALNKAIDAIATKSEVATGKLADIGKTDTTNFKTIAKAAKKTGKQAGALKATANQFQRVSKWMQKSATSSATLNTNLEVMSGTISRNMIMYKAYTSGLAGAVGIMQQLKEQTRQTIEEMNRQKTAITTLTTKHRSLNRTLDTTSKKYTQLADSMNGAKKHYGSTGKGIRGIGTAGKNGANGVSKFAKSLISADMESAALRASLNALGTHMGIFTGKTILVATAFFATVTAIKTMITVGSDFTREMIRSTAVIGANAAEAQNLENKVRSLAKSTIYTSGEVASGLTYLGMAGLSAKEATDALEPSLNIAKIGAISFAESADIVTNVLRGFRLEASDLGDVADDLATAITSSNATIQQLAKSLSYVAPLAASAGGSVREVVSILAVMHDVGIKSSRAGTALRRAYSNFLAPTKKVQTTLAKLNVTLTDGNGKMRAMTHILRDIVDAGSSAGDTVALFGVRAAAAMQATFDDLRAVNPKLQFMLAKLSENAHAAKNLGEAFEKYLGAEARKLISALHDKMIDVFKANEQLFTDIIRKIKAFVQGLDTEKIANFVEYVARLIKVFIDLGAILLTVGGKLSGSDTFTRITKGANALADSLGLLNLDFTYLKKKTADAKKALTELGVPVDSVAKSIKKSWGGQLVVDMWELAKSWYGLGDGMEAVGEAAAGASSDLVNYNGEITKMVEMETKLGDAYRSLPKELVDYLKNKGEWNVETTFVQQRMSQLETKEKSLNKIEAMITRELGTSSVILEGLGNSNADQIIRKETLALSQSLQAMYMMLRDYKEQISSEYGDMMVFEVSPQDVINRKAFRDSIVGAQNTYDFEAEVDKVKEAAKRAENAITRQHDQGVMADEAFINKLRAVSASTQAKTMAIYDTQMQKLQDEKKRLYTKIGIDEKTNDIPINGFSDVDGSAIYDTKTFDGGDRLKALYGEINKLGDTIRKTDNEARESRKGALHDYLMDLSKGANLGSALEDLQEYNTELGLNVIAQKKKNEAMITGDKSTKEYLTTAQLLKDQEIDNAIASLENARAKSKVASGSDKLIERYDLEIAAMKRLRGEIGANTKALDEAKRREAAIKEEQDRIKDLKKMDFLPDKIKARYDYETDKEKLDDFYTYKYGKYQEDSDAYAEFIEARQIMDMEYWESQNEGWAEFFDSLGDNMAKALGDLIIYQESWKNVKDVIAIGVAQSAIKAIVDMGAEFMKVHFMKMFAKKAETAQDTADSMIRQGLVIKEAGTKAVANASANAASEAAAAKGAGMIAGLIGEGNAMLASWLPAATAVNVASFGAAAIAATATMAMAQTAATVGAVGSGFASGAGGAAVAGRENGGLMQANRPYLVGEAGMELVVPSVNSMVVANKDLKNANSPFNKSPDESGVSGDIRIVNAIDPEFIEDYLGGQEGERVILNVMRKNKGKFD